jgi:hypothetical protein
MPRTGRSHRKISGSYRAASSALTELGPPDIIIALKKIQLYIYSSHIIHKDLFQDVCYKYILLNKKMGLAAKGILVERLKVN